MRAIILQAHGGPDQLVAAERPVPEPTPGNVRIRVRALGLNHAEVYFREGIWPGAEITGIECVGTVDLAPSGEFESGQRVAAMVGGLGRDRNGSYAEYVCAPASNVVAIDSSLSWERLAALPESYATAWVCLHHNLALEPGQTLLVRGETSALGQAAIQLAKDVGAQVLATTRRAERLEGLRNLGADTPLLDAVDLATEVHRLYPSGIDAVLDLVGTSTLRDSLCAARASGRVCIAGFLGGGEPLPAFNPLTDLPSGVQLSFFASAFVLGTPEWPLAEIPFNHIAARVADGTFQAEPTATFTFDEIQAAHRLLESGEANGKIVVTLP